MFRDSEGYLKSTLDRLEALEAHSSNFSFEYFFYENDSQDNTVRILDEWMQTRRGFLVSEKLDRPKFNHSTESERQIFMTDYRNRLLHSCQPLLSDFAIILDSDIMFEPSLIEDYMPYMTEDVAMATPNILQNIKCKMFDSSKDSYYDSWALIDSNGHMGMTWSSNPFYNVKDRDNWDNGNPVVVKSAFGGCPIIKSEVLNKIRWATRGGCEHWHFCQMASEFGKVIAIPNIIVRAEVPDVLSFPQETTLISQQKRRFSLLNGF